jgi:Flp pilus assembly protein TadD
MTITAGKRMLLAVLLPLLCFGCATVDESFSDEQRRIFADRVAEQHSAASEPNGLKPDHLALARNLVARGYYEVALGQLECAARDNSSRSEVYHLMGVCHRELADYEKARAYFKKAIAGDRQFAPAYNGLGITYDLLGDKEKAWKSFEAALRFNPARAAFYNNLGFSKMSAGELEAAEESFLKGLALEPRHPLLVNNLAICYGLRGRDEEAFSLLKERFSPAEACNNMGAIHLMRGERGKAEEMFEKALELDPEFQRAN